VSEAAGIGLVELPARALSASGRQRSSGAEIGAAHAGMVEGASG